MHAPGSAPRSSFGSSIYKALLSDPEDDKISPKKNCTYLDNHLPTLRFRLVLRLLKGSNLEPTQYPTSGDR